MQHFVYFTVQEGAPMTPPSPEGMAKMGKLMEEAFESGKIVATGRLPRTSTHINLEQDSFSVSDGPFIEGKDMIPGFTVIETETKEEALAWAKELRQCMGNGQLRMAELSGTSKAEL